MYPEQVGWTKVKGQDLLVSRANTSIGQRSFSIADPVVWNALPPDLRSPHISRQQFWSKLKTHLFRQAYNTTAWFLWEQFAEECNFVIVIVIVKQMLNMCWFGVCIGLSVGC